MKALLCGLEIYKISNSGNQRRIEMLGDEHESDFRLSPDESFK